jgi:hypothetical protein
MLTRVGLVVPPAVEPILRSDLQRFPIRNPPKFC